VSRRPPQWVLFFLRFFALPAYASGGAVFIPLSFFNDLERFGISSLVPSYNPPTISIN
jgi:hypothetical protein